MNTSSFDNPTLQSRQISQINSINLPSQYITSDWNTNTQDKSRLITTLHTIYTIDTSPDGKYIASAGRGDYSIYIWDPKSGLQVEESLIGHNAAVFSVKYSKNGDRLVSSSADQTIRQWDTKTHKQIGSPLVGHDSYVVGVSYTLDQKYIISASVDQTIRLWNAKTGHESIERRILSPVCRMIVSPTMQQVAFINQTVIYIWDYNKHKQIGELIGHLKTIWSISYSNDGTLIVSSSEDLTIRVWDMMTRQQIGHNIIGHTGVSINLSPNMQFIISGGSDQTVRIWNRSTGKQIGESLAHHKEQVVAVLFSLDGRYIITGGFDKQIMIMEHQYA